MQENESFFDIGKREFDLIIKLQREGNLSSDEWIIFALESKMSFSFATNKLNEKQKKSLLVKLKRRLEILS